MFKFLRRYSKWILAVGGTLLMITYLIPEAINVLSQRAAIGSASWATVDGEEVSGEVLEECRRDLQYFENLGMPVQPFGILRDPGHWYLLRREAEAAGVLGGRASDVLPADQMALIFARLGQSTSADVDEAIGAWVGVTRLMAMYQGAGELSDNRLRREAAELLQQVDVRLVFLEAEAREDAPAPSEEEIVAQYEKYREVDPASAEGDRFGYRRPDRFKLEWLTISGEEILAFVEASDDLNDIALAKHWQQNANTRAIPPFEAGAPIPDRVRTDLLEKLRGETRDRIERFANNRLVESRRRLPTQNAYYQLPEDWAARRADFTALTEAVRDAFPGLALPAYEAVGDRWLTTRDLVDLEQGLSAASTAQYGPTMRIEQLIGAAKEFGGNDIVLIQEGVAGPPLRTFDNGILFFRITATDPARPPRDLDEVRDEVVADLKRLHDYEKLQAEASQIEEQAKRDGLLALALARDAEIHTARNVARYDPSLLQFQLGQRTGLSPQATGLPVIGANDGAIQAIVERVMTLPRDRPMTDVARADRTFTVPVDDRMVLAVVEVEGQVPVDRDIFDQVVAAGFPFMIANRELIELDAPVSVAFSYETLAARHRFDVTRGDEEETDATDGIDDGKTETTAAAGGS